MKNLFYPQLFKRLDNLQKHTQLSIQISLHKQQLSDKSFQS